jgi:methyl-accepting chemotaxis protein
MKVSLQKKFLAVCILLVLLTIAGLSGTYYVLIGRIMRHKSRQQIQIAFDIILNEFENRANSSINRTREFVVEDTLRVTTSSYLQDEERIGSISFVSTNLAKAAEELKRFGRVNSAQKVLLYGANKRLLASYQRDSEQEFTGVYVMLPKGDDVYLPLDDPTQLTSMLLGRTAIPEDSFPDGLLTSYDAEIPDAVSANVFAEETMLGIRITAPIADQETITGVLIIENMYTQDLVERYATLSQTSVNIFAHERLSVGTLLTQAHLEPEAMSSIVPCERIRNQVVGMEVSSLTLGEQTYYHGQCSLTNTQGAIGAITISLPQDAEQQEIRTLRSAVLIASGMAFVLTFGLSVALTRKSTRSVQNIVQVIEAVAEGDLRENATVMTRDEFGSLALKLNQMIGHLRTIVGQVQRSGIQVTSSSTELAATAKQQEVTMRNQIASTDNVVKSVKEISGVTEELVQAMQRVASKSQETAGFASSGQQDLARMESTMQRMEEASGSISGKLRAINEKAENITSVVTTITKVADQTNLLSLNAAIEAEKAGETGRGFTVVATEIRRLADQTAVATLDIEQMVEEMQSAVSDGVMEMDKFIDEVRHSAEDVEKISIQLTRIIEQIQDLSPQFDDVNVAMSQQSGHAHEINDAMALLSEELQQTTASLRESFFAIEQLNEAAKGLQDKVAQFRCPSA